MKVVQAVFGSSEEEAGSVVGCVYFRWNEGTGYVGETSRKASQRAQGDAARHGGWYILPGTEGSKPAQGLRRIPVFSVSAQGWKE